jgi:hypothetical protein
MSENVNDPRCANTEGRQSEAQLSAGTSPAILPRDAEAVSAHAEKFKRAEDDGTVSAARWITHPEVRKRVDAWRPRAMLIAAPPFGRHLGDSDPLTAEVNIMRLAWHLASLRGIGPDLELSDENGPWMLEAYEAERTACAVKRLRALVKVVAKAIEAAGAPIDPEWEGDRAVLALLLLTPPPVIPWGGRWNGNEWLSQPDPVALARWAYAPSPVAITADATGIRSRFDASQNSARNVLDIQFAYRDQVRADANKPKRTAAPYARGGKRAASRQDKLKAARLYALAEVRALYPDAKGRDLLTGWSKKSGDPGHLYRSLIAQQFGVSHDAACSLKPGLRTVERDCSTLGIPINP